MTESIDSPYIVAVTKETFKNIVLENSQKGPVLVNFWSKSAGPAIRQYPILDKVIHHYNGCLLLVNCDVDVEKSVASDYAVTSVPTLKLFVQQSVVKTMHGYQSETDLIRLLNRYVSLPSDLKLSEAITLYSQGQPEEAYQQISRIILDDPENPRIPLALCKLLKHEQRFEEALALIKTLQEAIKGTLEFRLLEDDLNFIKTTLLIEDAEQLLKQAAESPHNLELQEQLVAFYVVNKDEAKALEVLLQMLEVDETFKSGYPRVAMIKIFNRLGQSHPLVKIYREKLSA